MPQPGLWPISMHRPTASRAEMAVYEALGRELPNGWYAWHSLRIRTGDGGDAEADFVIAAPRRGILILEVKGGLIEVRDGHWYSNSLPLRQPPRDQALRFGRELTRALHAGNCSPPAWGVASCFPDTSFSEEPSQADMAGRVLGRQDLPWLGAALMEIMEHELGHRLRARGPWLQALHTMWCESWVPRISLGQMASMREEEMLRLDGEQLSVLEGLEDNDSVLVTGAAGTGKTILARAMALRLAERGRRVLLLCFTEALARRLAEATPHAGVEVRPIKRYALQLLEQAGVKVAVEESQAFWGRITWRAADEALPKLSLGHDALIVDECQDLNTEDWMLVEELARGRALWGFCDPAQAFWPDREVPEKLFVARYRLRNAYRCPDAIGSLAAMYNGAEAPEGVIRDAIDKEIIALRPCPGTSSVADKIAVEIDKLLSAGMKPPQIAILSLRGAAEPESIVHARKLGRHSLARADDEVAGSEIVAETFLRFKGLERPAVIVTDLHLAQDREDYGKRMHIALTRALDAVRIVDAKETLLRDPVLAPYCGG